MTTLTRSTTRSIWLPLLAFVPLVACGDGTAPAPSGRLAEELHFLRPAASAPPLATTEVSFWAKRGEDREARIRYEPLPGASDTAEFLRFSVPSAALDRRPDGTAFAAGDSVLITLRVADQTRMIVEFQPAGLRFSPADPARLRIEYGEADHDLDGDGLIDGRDAVLETQLSVWRQEAPGQPWYPVPSADAPDLDEVEANILGFTSYALAY